MLSFKKKPRAVAEIHLSARSDIVATTDSNNSWLSNEDISGFAVFRLPAAVDFSHSKVSLKGVVITRTDENPPGSFQRQWRTEKLPFLGVALDSRPRAEFSADDGVIKIPFRFNLDDIQSSSSVVSDLPPSVNSKDDSSRWVSMRKYELSSEYEVTYTITAAVFSKRGLEASKTKTISVLPVSQVQPPLSPSDFPGEYFFAASTPQQSRPLLTRTSGDRIEVAGQEPEPILLNARASFSNCSTQVPFIVKVLPSTLELASTDHLPRQCRLKAQLVTKTLVTPNRVREKAIPTLEQAEYGEDSYLRLNKSDAQEFTIATPAWSHVTPSKFMPCPTEQFSVAKFSFLFNLTGAKQVPSPTFFTPLLSRRYGIEITLSFPEMSCPSLKLSLPLQIVYEADAPKYVKSN